MTLKRITAPGRWEIYLFPFLLFKSFCRAQASPLFSPLLAPNLSKCLLFSITLKENLHSYYQEVRLILLVFQIRPEAYWLKENVSERHTELIYKGQTTHGATLVAVSGEPPSLWHTCVNVIVCWRLLLKPGGETPSLLVKKGPEKEIVELYEPNRKYKSTSHPGFPAYVARSPRKANTACSPCPTPLPGTAPLDNCGPQLSPDDRKVRR